MPKVLISDALSPRAAQIFAARGIEVDLAPGLGPEELKARIGGYGGLAVRSATKVTAGLIARAENLKVIGRAGIGVDNIDVARAGGRSRHRKSVARCALCPRRLHHSPYPADRGHQKPDRCPGNCQDEARRAPSELCPRRSRR